jgi:hypothetical protein
MPVIPFIPLIVGAVAGVASAKVTANAANRATTQLTSAQRAASNQQAIAARNAEDVATRNYDTSLARLQPYQLGNGASAAMAKLMGINPSAMAPVPSFSPIPVPATPAAGTAINRYTARAMTPQMTSGRVNPATATTVSPSALSALTPPSTGTATVRMVAPDGSQSWVPSTHVQLALSRGAQIVQ